MKHPKWLIQTACVLALTPLACTDDSHVGRSRVPKDSEMVPAGTPTPTPSPNALPGMNSSPNSMNSNGTSNPNLTGTNPQDPANPGNPNVGGGAPNAEGSTRGRTTPVSGGAVNGTTNGKNQPGMVSEKITMPLSSYILQVRLLQSQAKVENLSARFTNETRSPDQVRLEQFKLDKMPQSPTDIVYLFLRPGDQIEISYRLVPSTQGGTVSPGAPAPNPSLPTSASGTSPFEFQALGVDSCEQLAHQDPTSVFNQMRQALGAKATFLQLISCLGNTRFIESLRTRTTGQSAKDFVQDWYDLSVSSAEKGSMDPLSRAINAISLYRFMIGYSKNVVIPSNINSTASRELDNAFQKAVRGVPTEYRKLAGLVFIAEALQVRVMDDILSYLKEAQSKRIRYKGITESQQHRNWLSQRIKDYKNRIREILQIQTQNNPGANDENIISGMLSILKSSSVPDSSNKSILQSDLQSMAKSYRNFQKEFDRIQSLLSDKNNDVVDVKFLKSQWENFITNSNRFVEKTSQLMDSGRSLSNKESADQFNSFRNTLLPEIKSQLQAYIQELNSPALSESIFKRGLGTKPFLDLDVQTIGNSNSSIDNDTEDLKEIKETKEVSETTTGSLRGSHNSSPRSEKTDDALDED